MLNLNGLEADLKKCFEDVLPGAFEVAYRSMLPENTKEGKEMCKRFGEILSEQLSEALSKGIASAIDYYIKSGSIKGTIITAGSPFTQTAVIAPINLGNPTAGSVPNTLGII